jgi:hypothetical protein
VDAENAGSTHGKVTDYRGSTVGLRRSRDAGRFFGTGTAEHAGPGRLSHALTELGARIRTGAAPDGLPFGHDATSLAAAEVWNLVCDDGEFDISFRPCGFATGYVELAAGAHRVRVGDVEVMVADLADVIRSKEAAGRPKDLQVLPLLYRHQATRSTERQAEPG